MTQSALFAIPGVREPKPRTSARPPKPVWSEYRVLNQVKCHRCVSDELASWPIGPTRLGLIPTARYQRRCGTERLLVCAEDARVLKAEDAAVEAAAQAVAWKRPRARSVVESDGE